MPRDWTRKYTDMVNDLDIRKFQIGRQGRQNLLEPGNAFLWQWTRRGVVVADARFLVHEDRVDVSCNGSVTRVISIKIVRTSCNLGGSRAWWLCPSCGRRAAVLYRWSTFECRKCQSVHYKCQSENDQERVLRRANSLRRRLGWGPGVANPRGSKPRGMHWRTYKALTALYDCEEWLVFGNLGAWLGARRVNG